MEPYIYVHGSMLKPFIHFEECQSRTSFRSHLDSACIVFSRHVVYTLWTYSPPVAFYFLFSVICQCLLVILCQLGLYSKATFHLQSSYLSPYNWVSADLLPTYVLNKYHVDFSENSPNLLCMRILSIIS